jgi:hypothetical protein
MEKKKILVISRSFYPDNSPRSFRTTELVKEFVRQGHEVTLLTKERPDFDYTEFLTHYPIRLESFGALRWKVFKKSILFGDWSRKFGRLLHLFLEYPNIEVMWRLRQVLPKYRDFDLLISIAVPHPVHWGVAWVRSTQHPIAATWVADCGDPFMGNTLESIRPPFYFSFLEKAFCRKADYISIPTEGAKKGYYAAFQNKLIVIPQGFDFDAIAIDKRPVDNDLVTFAYAGGLAATGIRSPHKIISFLLAQEIAFRFHVYSSNSGVLQAMAQKAPDSIILHASLPREVLLPELAKMDFLLNLDNGTSNQTPSKMIDYALTGRPILNIEADNFDTSLLLEFMRKNYSRQTTIDHMEHYDIKNVTRKFLALHHD